MSNRISDEELLEEIRRVADRIENPPTASEMDLHGEYGTTTYSSRFGSWNEALQAAGFETNRKSNIPEEDLIEELQRLADELEGTPTYKDMTRDGEFSPSTYLRRWESWYEALTVAGCSPKSGQRQNIPNKDLLDELDRLSSGSVPPTESEMAQKGNYSPDVYQDRWGSWNEAVEAAGYTPHRETDISREGLQDEICRLAENGVPPSRREMAKQGRYSPSAYLNCWGSWNNAIQAAGYTPKEENDIDRTDLLDEIRRLKKELGSVPTYADMDDCGNYSTRPYVDQFHSWWAAIVRSDCDPHDRHPLCPEAYHRFFNQALSRQHKYPTQALIGLFIQFTGITAPILTSLSDEWLKTPADDVVISIPPKHTSSEQHWEFRLPDTWYNPFTEQKEPTMLPGLLQWYLDEYDGLEITNKYSVNRYVFYIADEAGLSEFRPTITHTDLGTVPKVRPSDLRMTHGVHLAQNNAPTKLIKRRLGMEHLETDIDIESIYIWIEERLDE